MNKQDELLANPPAEAVPPLRFFQATDKADDIRMCDANGGYWFSEEDKTPLEWLAGVASAKPEIWLESPYWKEVFPTTDATVVEMPVPADDYTTTDMLAASIEVVTGRSPEESAKAAAEYIDDGPQTVEVPMIDPKVTALQERFAEVLANPPEGIDTAVVKPFYDPNDNDVNLVDPDTRQTFGYWGEASKRWYVTGSARYSEDKFDTLIRLRWTAGAATIEAGQVPEDAKDAEHYTQGWRDGAKARSAEWQAEVATLADQLADAQTNVEAHAQRLGEVDDELKAAYTEIAELGEQLLTAQSQRDDAESKLTAVHEFQIGSQPYRVWHKDLLPMLREVLESSQSYQAAAESYRQKLVSVNERLAEKIAESKRLANQLGAIRKMSKVVR